MNQGRRWERVSLRRGPNAARPLMERQCRMCRNRSRVLNHSGTWETMPMQRTHRLRRRSKGWGEHLRSSQCLYCDFGRSSLFLYVTRLLVVLGSAIPLNKIFGHNIGIETPQGRTLEVSQSYRASVIRTLDLQWNRVATDLLRFQGNLVGREGILIPQPDNIELTACCQLYSWGATGLCGNIGLL